jgi:nucleotide-binding universal stress UspA family protein
MYKILAPTDFSNNSKGGMRFAMQWASQLKAEIVFVHVYHPIIYPNRTEKEIDFNTARQTERLTIKLKKLVETLYITTHLKSGKHSSLVILGRLSADIDIMDYCRNKGDIDFICISTRGGGRMAKLLGTHTGTLITKSQVPVIAVPRHYRKTPITNLLYASDLKNYFRELKKVIAFAQPLHAKIDVLHLTPGPVMTVVDEKYERQIRNKFNYDIKFLIKNIRSSESFVNFLKKEKFVRKPSLLIMFTEQRRNFLKKILSPSKTENLSFATSIPLLAFHKD